MGEKNTMNIKSVGQLEKYLGWGVFIVVFFGFANIIRTRSQRDHPQREAMYAAVLQHVARSKDNLFNDKMLKTFFVEIEEKDASPEFIQRFSGSGISVYPLSQAKNPGSKETGDITTDKTGKRTGVVVKFEGTHLIKGTDTRVAVASTYAFSVEKIGDNWRVQQ
jgi:hypothetical protein